MRMYAQLQRAYIWRARNALPYTRGQGCEMTTAMRKGYMKERTWKGHGGILRKEGRGTGERTDEDDEAPIE